MQKFDAIVVGGRCAGAVVAGFLGRAGVHVLLLERNLFPSDVISTHTIFNNTVLTLRELGVMERLLKDDTPAVKHMRAQMEDAVVAGKLPHYQNEENSYCFKRTFFDQVLFEHARSQPTVTGIEGFRVTDLLVEDGVVVGVRGHDRAGVQAEYRARIVIGADGRTSTVRKLSNSKKKTSTRGEIGYCYGYFAGVETFDDVAYELYVKDLNRAYIFPTGDGHHVVVAGFPNEDKDMLQAFKSEPEKTIRTVYEQCFPRAAQRIANAQLVGECRALFHLENYWYEGMGPGWALVGDAICFKDPGVGQGMHDAIYGARMLAELLIRHTDWEKSWTEMATEYQTAAEQEFMARYEAACQVAVAGPTPQEEIEMLRAVSGNPLAIEKFLGFYNYTAEREDLVKVLQPQEK